MAITEVAPAGAAPGTREPQRRSFLANPWLLLAASLGLLLIFGWTYLVHPTITAPTRDPFWYTWRAELLAHAAPKSIVQDWGPFGMFSGGYRVTTPLLGALLTQLGGVSRFTFSILVMVGAPVLASLALAAFAWRHRRDPMLFLLTLFASGALFLTVPYVGYMDNVVCLYLLAMTLPFLGAARTSWGARSAVFLLMFLATLTHPTTTAVFAVVLIALAGVHLLTSRLSFKRTLEADGPVLVAAGLGSIFGLAMWKVGAWGVQAPFADAALPPPYPAAEFKATLWQWIAALKPLITLPLIAVAVVAIVLAARRARGEGRVDEYPMMSLLWLLPLIGMFGWALGKAYPYYRFMNTTLAPLLLVGMGAWVVIRLLLNRSRAGGLVAAAVVLAGLSYVMASGFGPWSDPGARFLDPPARASLASVDAYAAAGNPARPILFVTNFGENEKAWGWAKTYANAARAGLSGDEALRSAVYFGDFKAFVSDQPTPSFDHTYSRVSRGFYSEMQNHLKRYPEAPQVFVVRLFNHGTSNESVIDSAHPAPGVTSTKLGPDVAVVSGQGLAPLSSQGVRAGTAAGARLDAALTDPPGRFSDAGGLARIVALLLFILLVPGLIAMRWFEIEDFPSRLALVPGTSISLVLFSAFVVEAVHRAPFGVASGIASLILATAIAVVLHLLYRRRVAGKAVVMPFVRRSLSLFSNSSFGYLMGTVFLAVLGDGIVQGTLAKTIAFGGAKGFDISKARSARDILGIILLTYLPYTFISPFMGVLIDRFDRRKLLFMANGVRAGIIVVAGLIGVSRLGDAALIGALLLTLASTRLVLAIKSAGIPVVLRGRDLMQGNSISQAGSAVFQITGAAIALVGTKVLPAGVMLVAGGAVYGVGALFARRVGDLATGRREAGFGSAVRQMAHNIWEGLKQVRARAAARLGLFSFLVLRALVSFVALVFALEVRQILGGNSSKTGVLIAAAAGAAGAALGFVLAQWLKDRVAPARLLVGAMLLAGAGVTAFGGVLSVLGLSVVSFVALLAYFVGKISADTITQQALPDDFRGRAFSLFDVAYNLAWILPALVLFALWSYSRARLLLIGSGVLFLTCAVLIALWARRLERRETAGAAPAVSTRN